MIPPRLLQNSTNASTDPSMPAVGTATTPDLSEMTPIVIVVSVTPRSVAPCAGRSLPQPGSSVPTMAVRGSGRRGRCCGAFAAGRRAALARAARREAHREHEDEPKSSLQPTPFVRSGELSLRTFTFARSCIANRRMDVAQGSNGPVLSARELVMLRVTQAQEAIRASGPCRRVEGEHEEVLSDGRDIEGKEVHTHPGLRPRRRDKGAHARPVDTHDLTRRERRRAAGPGDARRGRYGRQDATAESRDS